MASMSKHLVEQILNGSSDRHNVYVYEKYESTVLAELFFMLEDCLAFKHPDGEVEPEETRMVEAYCAVIEDFLAPMHFKIFYKILEDHRNELLQEEPQPQTEEGQG